MVINGVGDRSRGTTEDYDASFECERTIISFTVSGRAGNIWIFWSDAIGPFIPSCAFSPLCMEMFSHCVFFFSSSRSPSSSLSALRQPTDFTEVIQTLSRVLFSVTDSTTAPMTGWENNKWRANFYFQTASKLLKTLLPRTPRGRDSILHQRGRCRVLWRDG